MKDEEDYLIYSNHNRDLRERELRDQGYNEAEVRDFIAKEFRD